MKKQLLLLIMILLPLVASADAIEINGIYYNLIEEGHTAEVTSKPNRYTGNIVIPGSVNYNDVTYSVTSIGAGAFQSCSSLTSIEIPSSVTSIGGSAFSNCYDLTSITIPNSVTSIGDYAFSVCTGLTSIVIPNSVTSIGSYAFSSCRGLTSITISNSVTNIGSLAFSSCWGLTSINVDETNPKYDSRDNCNAIIEKETNTLIVGCKNTVIPHSVTSIGSAAFDGSGLITITIPNSVTSIGSGAFNRSGLTSIIIPNSVTSIGESAFYGCSVLASINVDESNPKYNSRDNCNAIIEKETNTLVVGCKNTVIPNNVTSIGSGAFAGSGLTSITIPNNVTSIGESAFERCLGLISVTIPNSVTSIGNSAFFDCTALTSIEIPNSVTSIGYGVFSWCYRLTSVTIPNSVTSIGDYAFPFCYGLTSITIPNSVTSIGTGAFKGCSGFTSITIPNSVTSIGQLAFLDCSGLTSVTIPNSVTSIGNEAFSGCSALTSVFVEMETPVNITYGVFTNRANATLYVPQGCVDAYKAADYWKEFKEIKETKAVTNIVFADANVKAICVANWDTNKDGELDTEEAAAVTDLGTVFKNTNITSFNELKYFTGLTSIGASAFSGCLNLASVTIPNSVTNIGNNAFESSWLTSVTIPNSVTSIGDDAFSYCSGLTSVTIGNGVESIGARAFYLCFGLASIEIPNSVTSIDLGAFGGCTGLTSVTIPNSVISISRSVFSKCTSLTSINVDASNTKYDSRDNCNAIIEKETNTLISGCKNTVIPNGVTSIGDYAFSGCSGLTSVTIPNSVTNIGTYAFSNCTGLTSVTIPNSITSIGSDAFHSCSSLTSIEIPNSVTSIGDKAFYRCDGLASVVVKKEVPINITSEVFSNRANATLYVPQGCVDAYKAADYWKEFKEIKEFKEGVTNIVFADANVKAICVANWDTNKDGELDTEEAAAVTDLGTVFKGNTTITSFDELKYFTSLTSIGDFAFYGCSGLTSIEIPSSVIHIGPFAFNGCSGLKKVIVPDIAAWCSVIFDSTDCNPLSHAKHLYSDENTEITDLIIPSSVTSIIGGAFRGCSSLTSITIPNSVTSIGSNAFYGCSGLTSIIIPNSVASIGDGAFAACSSLTSINVDVNNSKYDSRDNCNAIIEKETNKLVTGCNTTVIPNSVASIGDGAFLLCRGLTSITIPNSVTSIGGSAFAACFDLTSITIPNSVTSIDDCAFQQCTSLSSIEIPNSVTSIGVWAFYGCTGLTSVMIPYSVTSIGQYAFDQCKSLTSVTIDSNHILYGSEILSNYFGEQVQSYIVGNNVTSIGNHVFSGCTGLTSVTIGNRVTSIGYQAFYDCTNLTTVTIDNNYIMSGSSNLSEFFGDQVQTFIIGNSVTSIGGGGRAAFYGFPSLTSVTIGSGVTSINANPFAGCSGNITIHVDANNSKYDSRYNCNAIIEKETNTLVAGCKNTVIPNSVTSIGDNAFYNCFNLTAITIPNSVTSIGLYAFGSCSGLTSIEIPNSVTSIGNYAFAYCTDLTSINVDANNPKYDSRYNCNAIIEKETNTLVVGCKNSIIPNDVTCIGFVAFYGCSGLTSIEIPSSVISIGNAAFANCPDLTSINVDASNPKYDSRDNCNAIIEKETNKLVVGCKNTVIPNSVTSIGDYAFRNCSDLTSIEISNNVTSIGIQAFYGCSSLTSVTIPNSVTSIGNYTFYQCYGLTSVTIGNSVTSIGDYAFRNCYNLTSVKVYAKTPPAAGTGTFYNYQDVSLYVPRGSKAAYEAADIWKEFSSIIEFDDIIKGDANGDGEVNVADVVEIVNYIMDKPSDKFVFAAADMNDDGEVNIGDVILIVKWILNNTSNSANAVSRRAGEIIDIRQFTAAQFEMKVPANVRVKDIRLVNSMMQSHQIMYQQMDEQTYAVVVYSPTNQLFVPYNNNIVEVETESGESEYLTIHNAILAKPDGEVANYTGNFASITGVKSVRNDEKPAVIYDLKGNRLENGNSLKKGIYIINGKKVIVK